MMFKWDFLRAGAVPKTLVTRERIIINNKNLNGSYQYP